MLLFLLQVQGQYFYDTCDYLFWTVASFPATVTIGEPFLVTYRLNLIYFSPNPLVFAMLLNGDIVVESVFFQSGHSYSQRRPS